MPDANAQNVHTAPAIPLANAFARDRRAGILPTHGLFYWYRVPVVLPANADPNWPVVLEWDESRLIHDATLDGVPLPAPNRDGNLWVGGEGWILLPLNTARSKGQLAFRTQYLDQLYDNGFGRLRLRPATFLEALHPDRGDQDVTIHNRSPLPFAFKLTFKAEDYFGTPLGEGTATVNVDAGSKAAVALPPEVRADGKAGRKLYKVRIQLSAAGRVSPEYWKLRNSSVENNIYPEVTQEKLEWEWAPATAGFDKPAPADGWQKLDGRNVSHEKLGKNVHTAWMRTMVNVPGDWKSPRARLWISSLGTHATIYADGQLLGEYSSWQLPGFITLPPSAKPGGKTELVFAVTDGTYGVLPAWPGNRTVAAPIGDGNGSPGVGSTELVGVPEVRTNWTFIRTQTVGVKTLSARLEFANDSRFPANVTPTVTVLDHGQVVFTKGLMPFDAPAGKVVAADIGPIPVPSAKLWSPETPHLYEFRVELRNSVGQIVDVRRERFGFRQFEKVGQHYEPNGERVNLLGASHYVPSDDTAWPATPYYNRLIRYYYPGGQNLMQGRVGINLAEEMGMPLKIELGGMGALHRETFAYQDDRTWQRMVEALRAYNVNLINNPALLFMNYGNELNYQRPGELEKFAEVIRKFRAFDPTRLVTESGGIPNNIPGAEIWDAHGWPHHDSRRDWFFYHPEDRPPSEKAEKGGFYVTRPKDAAPDEKIDSTENKVMLFSEGHYYEQAINPDLNGPAGWLNLEGGDGASLHQINGVSLRKRTVQSARVAGFAGTIIHVDRGVGRWVQPLMATSIDRRTRFANGSPAMTRFRVFHDLAGSRAVQAKFTLFDGEKVLGTKDFDQVLLGGGFADVDLNFPLPVGDQDQEYRLHVEVSAAGYAGYFRDDISLDRVRAAEVHATGRADARGFRSSRRHRQLPQGAERGVHARRQDRGLEADA